MIFCFGFGLTLVSPAQETDFECFTGGKMQNQSMCSRLLNSLSFPLTVSLISAHRHMQYLSSDTVAESRNNFKHTMPRGPTSTLYSFFCLLTTSLVPSLFPSSSQSHVGCNYEHGCRESVVLLYKMMTLHDVCP